jgi:hypothetical protein
LVTINTFPVNPDLDIPPTGNFEAFTSAHQEDSINLFDPDGHYKCTIPSYPFHYFALHPYTDPKQLIPTLISQGCFMLGSKAEGHKAAQMPAWIMKALLSRHPDWIDTTATSLGITPGCHSFLTPPNQTQPPASSGSWFSTPWTGFHILHHIPFNLAKKTLRWALSSAQQEHTPTAIIALIPEDDKWGAPWKEHPGAIHLATLPPQLATSIKGVTSGTQARATTSPKDKHSLYMFSNQAGRDILFPQWSHLAAKDLFSPHIDTQHRVDWAPLPACPSQPTAVSSKFLFLLPKALSAILAANLPHFYKKHLPLPTHPGLPPTPAPAWSQNQTWHVYTDGSRIKVGTDGSACGAGIYIQQTQQSYTVDPAGQGETNTINRAELGAEAAALQIIPDTRPATIFTDSLCTLLQINKYLPV